MMRRRGDGQGTRLASSETQDAKKGEGFCITGKTFAKSNEIPHRRNGRSAEMRAKRSPGSGRLGGCSGALRQRTISAAAKSSPQLYPAFGSLKTATRVCSHGWMDPNRVTPNFAAEPSGRVYSALRNPDGTGNPTTDLRGLSHQPLSVRKSSGNRVILRSLERRRPVGSTSAWIGVEVTECGTAAYGNE
ncbi:uncharacterized protein B0H64DRAFT_52958 [Chaetomium fimeti]|uniref:Uncharacterized protein n=1 Tax=Chaetomium fimeti TaxID=1854472 RepID=A0AAE0H606_9PEZI|nr:hypothetical protein B0H64DRAFT_52958 [Chaetomium fimeti]